MTLRDFIQKHNISRRTAYRWIETGKIQAFKNNGKWIIPDDTDIPHYDTNYDTEYLDLQQRIEEMREENEQLRQELTEAKQIIAEERQRYDDAQQRHDSAQQQSNMIVMQLTKQLEQQTLLIEDLRNKSLWKRVKAALGFASS